VRESISVQGRKQTMMLALIPLFVGCSGSPEIPPRPDTGAPNYAYNGGPFLSPAHGQTGLPTDVSLIAHGATSKLPENYPVPEAMRVTDLTDGGHVEGSTQQVLEDLLFTPSQAWQTGHRYAWTLDPKAGVPHGPELEFPEELIGTTVFDTSDGLEVLGVSYDLMGRLCLILSRPIAAEQTIDLRVHVNDEALEDVEFALLSEEEEEDIALFPLADNDPGLEIACTELSIPLEAGAGVRTWFAESGPWWFELTDTDWWPVIASLRRNEP